jgi:hypothetical protein
MDKFYISFLLLFSLAGFSQTPCSSILKPDSCTLKNAQKKESVGILEIKIKNNYQIQFIKQADKQYLKIIVRDNLGFGKKSSLLLISNKKQIYIKSIELQIIDKTSAYFLVDLTGTNYLENIKEYGLSSILFNESSEFGIPKSDSDQIKKAANCFFLIISRP